MSYSTVLMICIIPLFLIYWMIDHKRRSIQVLRNKGLSDLANALEKLSMEMNNQILLITTFNYDDIIRIAKYQKNGSWGMKVMLNIKDYMEKENLFNTLINDYEINETYCTRDTKVVDLGSDLTSVYRFIDLIITDIINVPSDIKFNFVFEKKSLAILSKLKSN